MSQLTRKHIINKTLELVAKKPVNKVTVREIVSECEITRNTFYYYFHDVYDVLDSVLSDKIDELYAIQPLDFERLIFDILDYCSEHKKVWLSVYNAMGRELFSKHIIDKFKVLLEAYMLSVAGEKGINPVDKDIILGFYEEAIVGILIRWLLSSNNSEEGDLKFICERIRILFDGQINLVVSNSEKNPPQK